MVLETEQARSRQSLDDALDVVAHHPDVRVCGWVAEAVVVQVGDDLLDTGFLGEALCELRRELRLAEDRLDLGGFSPSGRAVPARRPTALGPVKVR